MPPISPVIQVRHLHKHYKDKAALIDVNFDVHQKECLAFLGPNGAGKTTTMKILLAKTLPDKREETQINVFGFDPRKDELEIKARTGLVPQEDSLDTELNVQDNLRIFGRLYGLDHQVRERRIDELLGFLELTEKAKSRVRELSGGMKRRLVLARALMHDPSLLVLDEPTTGLDPQVRQLLWERVRELQKKGVTVLLTTHYMDEAFQLADRLLIIDKGKAILSGPPKTLLTEHLESHVMEIVDDAVEVYEKRLSGQKDIRLELAGSRLFLYSNQKLLLEELSADILAGEGQAGTYLRQTNLEDLFLKVTGRNLNAAQ
jgi:lipooligosaccharide transport system ATP-binding protein